TRSFQFSNSGANSVTKSFLCGLGAHAVQSFKRRGGTNHKYYQQLFLLFPNATQNTGHSTPEYALRLNSSKAIGNIFIARSASRSKYLVQMRVDRWFIGVGYGIYRL